MENIGGDGCDSLPEIDLTDTNAVSQIREACEQFGFFFLKNHMLDVESAFHESKCFFDCPLEFKTNYLVDKSAHLGYTTFQDETTCPEGQSCGDTKEGFYIGLETADADSAHQNKWPDPAVLPNWRSVMSSYHASCCALGAQLIGLLAEALNIPSSYFEDMIAEPTALVRLLKYGKITSDPVNGVFGAGAHSDYGLLTILATNQVPGLEIFVNERWIQIPPKPECVVVNLGDVLQRLTNGRFLSTVHRVVMSPPFDVDRYSIPFFYEPNRYSVVRCLDEFVSADNSAKYADVVYGEYLNDKYQRTHSDFKK